MSKLKYEVSSRGDKQFSALFATLEDGRTIESWYQCDVKGWNPGGRNWKIGKGKPPAPGFECSPTELYEKYKSLWKRWLNLNENRKALLKKIVITENQELTDMFAHGRPINQARVLMELAHELS